MSSKSKWDQLAPNDHQPSAPPPSGKEGKSDSNSAAAVAATAAKIATQFTSGALKDEAAFQHDFDINNVRNRYLLTKGSTQQEIHEETGASVSTKGVWYPDRSKATGRDPPMYLHITAATQEALQKAIDKINDLVNMGLEPLVEDMKVRLREKRKWPEEKLPIGLESISNSDVRAKVVGPSDSFLKYIQLETATHVQMKGLGSGFIERETGRESDEPLYIHIIGPDEDQVQRAKVLTEDLLLVVRQELHQAPAQQAAYSAVAAGYIPPPPTNARPPPPGEQPPPPTSGQTGAYDPSQTTMAAIGVPPAASDQDGFAAYWAAKGYDVNSPQFKEWAAQQQAQSAQYCVSQASNPTPTAPGDAPPPPPNSRDVPPPPPPQ